MFCETWLEVSLDDLTVYSTDGVEVWDLNSEGEKIKNTGELIRFIKELCEAGIIGPDKLDRLTMDIRSSSMQKYPDPPRITI